MTGHRAYSIGPLSSFNASLPLLLSVLEVAIRPTARLIKPSGDPQRHVLTTSDHVPLTSHGQVCLLCTIFNTCIESCSVEIPTKSSMVSGYDVLGKRQVSK